MQKNTIDNQHKPSFSTYKADDAKLIGNKANSNFKASAKKVTQTLISFFTLLFKHQNNPTENKKDKDISFQKNHRITNNNQIVNTVIPSVTLSSNDNLSANKEAAHVKLIPEVGLTGSPTVDDRREAILQKVSQRKTQFADKMRKNETDRLQKNNVLLINNYDDLSDIDRKKNHIINQLGCMILNHKEYSNSTGILRIEGSKNNVDDIINKINDSDNGPYFLSQIHDYPLPILSSAFKRIAGGLLKKTNNIDFKSSFSFGDLKRCNDAVKNKENITQQIKSNEQLKNKAPVILKNTDKRIASALSRLAPPTLTLQLVTRLCALISNDEASHQMSPKNLAIVFAPHLTSTHILDIFTIKDPKIAQLEIKKAKETNQLAESYIAALIHQEKNLFNHL